MAEIDNLKLETSNFLTDIIDQDIAEGFDREIHTRPVFSLVAP